MYFSYMVQYIPNSNFHPLIKIKIGMGGRAASRPSYTSQIPTEEKVDFFKAVRVGTR